MWPRDWSSDVCSSDLGTVMSDHSKTGINSMRTTGTNCGVCCNLFSDDYPPKLIPSFSWVNSDRRSEERRVGKEGILRTVPNPGNRGMSIILYEVIATH